MTPGSLIEHSFDDGRREPAAAAESTPRTDSVAIVTYALRRWRFLIVVCVVAGALAGFFYGAVQPNTYFAQGSLLLRAGLRESTNAETTITGLDSRSVSVRNVIDTEVELLSSRSLLKRVVERVGARRILAVPNPMLRDTEETPAFSRLLHRFQAWWWFERIEPEPGDPVAGESEAGAGDVAAVDDEAAQFLAEQQVERATDVLEQRISLRGSSAAATITVTILGFDPVVVGETTAAFLEEAEKFHREFFSTTSYLEVLSQKETVALEELEAAENALAELRDGLGVVALDTEIASLEAEVRQLDTSLFDKDRELGELAGTLSFLESATDAEAAAATGDDLDGEGALATNEGPDEPSTPQVRNPEYTRLESYLWQLRLMALGIDRRQGETDSDFRKRVGMVDDMIEETMEAMTLEGEFLPPAAAIRATPVDPAAAARELRLSRIREQNEKRAGLMAAREQIASRLAVRRDRLASLFEASLDYARLVARVDSARTEAASATRQRKDFTLIKMLDAQEMGNLRILQRAIPGEQKLGPNRAKFLALGLLFGIGLGGMLALGLSATSPRLQHVGFVQTALRRPIFGVFPQHRHWRRAIRALGRGWGAPPKGLRALAVNTWTAVVPKGAEDERRVVLVTGTGKAAGTTSLATVIAAGLAANTRKPTLLLETDFARPGLRSALELEDKAGLGEVLQGQRDWREVVQTPSALDLDVLHVGSKRPRHHGLFSDEAWTDFFAAVRAKYTFVVIDAAPLLESPDSRVLLWDADAMMVVVDAERAKRSDLTKIAQAAERADVELLGSLVNRHQSLLPSWIPMQDPGQPVS